MIKENLSDSGGIAISSISFGETLVAWQKRHGRHSLPWQNTRNAYRIWLSEIMLQQTQVATVIPYYLRFLERFPDVSALAYAEQEEVMSYWSGLGYYSRARNLHRCAQIIVEEYKGIFPSDPVLLEDLPGIGKSTAAAIAVFSSGVRAAILDGNVVRVFSRIFGIAEQASDKKEKEKLWQLAYELLPESRSGSLYTGFDGSGRDCMREKPAGLFNMSFFDFLHRIGRKPDRRTPCQKNEKSFPDPENDYVGFAFRRESPAGKKA